MPITKSKRCIASVKVEKCFYKKDLNYLSSQFTANDTAHNELKIQLHDISHIKLNGDDTETPLSEVIRDIHHAIIPLKEEKKVKEAYHLIGEKTRLGRLVRNRFGKGLMILFAVWVIISSLISFGVEGLKPIQLILFAAKLLGLHL